VEAEASRRLPSPGSPTGSPASRTAAGGPVSAWRCPTGGKGPREPRDPGRQRLGSSPDPAQSYPYVIRMRSEARKNLQGRPRPIARSKAPKRPDKSLAGLTLPACGRLLDLDRLPLGTGIAAPAPLRGGAARPWLPTAGVGGVRG
jgi:hypothetical protein